MTPEQYLKYAILLKDAEWKKEPIGTEIAADNIDDLYGKLVESDEHWDAKNEIRCGDVESGLPVAEYSRHYESKSVAANIAGRWVGWTYWYGGGKHANPGEIDWMDSAYFLDCVEEEKVVTVRIFTKLETVDAE